MESLTSAAQAFLEHLESGGRDSAADFLDKRGESDPETVEVLTVLAGLHERPREPDRIGPYRLKRELGRGAQGVVYLAHDSRLDREVALKVLTPEAAFGAELQGLMRDLNVAGPSRLAETVGALRRFKREVHAATRLDHPGICAVYEAGAADGASYIAMRYVEGESLAARIAQRGAATTRAAIDDVCALVAAAARALDAAHEAGLVHRDVKPGNIMVSTAGDPVILDFGLARQVDADMSQTGTAVGTPVYMSPEQITARAPADRRTDVYALGVVLFECAAARRPFDAPTLDRLYRDILEAEPPRLRAVPPELATVVETAMQKEPGRRYKTARDLAEDLDRVRARKPIRAKPPSALLRLRRWAERSPALAASVAAIVIALVVMTVLWQTTRTALDDKTTALRRARALALANASAVELDTNPQRALLLAREAARLELMPAVVTALHDALNRPMEVAVVTGHDNEVHSVEFSPAGDRLVTGSADHTARIWDTTGNELAVLRGHTDNVDGAVFSPDGRRVLTVSRDGTARIWSSEGGLLHVLEGHGDRVLGGAYSPDGAWIATGSKDMTVRLWHADGTPSDLILRHDQSVKTVEFSPDGKALLTTCWDKTVRLWDRQGNETARFPHRYLVYGATFSRDGSRILTYGPRIRVLQRDGSLLHEIRLMSGIARFSHDGRRLLVGSGPLDTGFWTFTGRRSTPLRGHEGTSHGIASSPDGRLVATASTDGTLRIWAPEARESVIFRANRSPLAYAAFSPDQTRIVTASGDRTARIWRLDGTEEAVLRGHTGSLYSAEFSPDGERVVTSSADRTARIWDVSGKELHVLRGHTSMLFHAAYSADGTQIVTASGDKTARVWDREGKPVRTLQAEGWVVHAAFTPDADDVLTVCMDGAVRLHDAGIAIPKQPWPADAAFSPRGDIFATVVRETPQIRLWSRTGDRVAAFAGHSSTVSSVAFSSDGRFVVTAGGDGTARIWGRDGVQRAVLRHGESVVCARFSPDGRYILTASPDAARLWYAHAEELVRVADERIVRDLTPSERRRFAELLSGS